MRHAHLGESEISLIFGQHINLDTQRDFQEASRRHLPALWRQLVSKISLEGEMCLAYTVFLLKVRDRAKAPQNGEGDMHEVPHLHRKVGPRFSGLSHHCPMAPSNPTRLETLQINLFGEV